MTIIWGVGGGENKFHLKMESHILGKDSLHFNVVEKVDWQNLPGFPGGFHLFF